MSKQPFEKFINPKVSGAKKKEVIRQEKKKAKAEVRAIGDEERKRNEVIYGVVTKENIEQVSKYKVQETRIKIQGTRENTKETRGKNQESRIQETRNKNQDSGIQNSRFGKQDSGEENQRLEKKKPFEKNVQTKNFNSADERINKRIVSDKPTAPFAKSERLKKDFSPTTNSAAPYVPASSAASNEPMPLNKYVAHAGICGRREAAILVKEGKVKVNGDIVYEPGYKVSSRDKVEVKDKLVFLQKNLVYILLNKPKDYITTAKDPEGRKTVFELVAHATKERIYPVGRLDRNTTGVLLMTNDGELAQKLTHPSFEIKKIYEVRLDKPLTKKDADAIAAGVTLEDGFIKADSVAYADAKDKSIIGIEIHSGRNRIVRRIFEFLGYDVRNLDRVMFANLTKKNVDRGKWRLLNEKEVRLLKFMNQSFVRNTKSE